MKSSGERRGGWLLIAGIVLSIVTLTAGKAFAALTVSGTSITGTSGIVIDTASSTISIGTSTATGITIGNPNATITISGPTTISATTTLQNLIASGLTISGLVSSSTQCLHVNASGVVSGTGFDCGSGSGSPSYTLASTSTIVSASNIGAWGDSLTSGNQDGSGVTYPNELALLEPGVSVSNFGVSGQTSTAITARFLAASNTWPWFTVIWSGRNNISPTSTVENDIANMVAQLPNPKQFIVMSILNGEYGPNESCANGGGTSYNIIQQLNNYFASEYPNNYLDIRSLLVDQYNPSIGADVIDYNNCVPPQSLRAVDASGTITTAITPSTTQFTVATTSVIVPSAGNILNVGSEKMYVTAASGTLITVTRGYGSTTAASYATSTGYTGIDTLHLSAAGYTFVAQKVANKIAQLASTTPTLVTSSLLPQALSNIVNSSVSSVVSSSLSGYISGASGTPPIYILNPSPNSPNPLEGGTTDYITLGGALMLPNANGNGILGYYNGTQVASILGANNGNVYIGGGYSGTTYFGNGRGGNTSINNCSSGANMGLTIATSSQCANALAFFGSDQFEGSSTVTTPSIGGSALTAGQCSSATSSIDTSVATSTAAFITTPETYISPASFNWASQLISQGVLETDVCAIIAGTPTSTKYNVKIIK